MTKQKSDEEQERKRHLSALIKMAHRVEKSERREPVAITRVRGPELAGSDEEKGQERMWLLPLLDEMRHRIEFNERLPPGLMVALGNFRLEEQTGRRRLAAYFAVLHAHEKGAALSRTGAFSIVAHRFNKSEHWVEAVYKEFKPNKRIKKV